MKAEVLVGGSAESFIIRVWLEIREVSGARSEVRGHIEHLATGDRESVSSYEAIVRFIDQVLTSSQGG